MADKTRPLSPQGVPTGVMEGLQSEVSAEAAPLLQFISNHAGKIVGLIVLLIAAIIATGGYQWYTEKKEREATLEIGRVLTGVPAQDRVAALEALLGQVPDSMKQGLTLEIAMAAVSTGDFAKAAEAFGKVGAVEKGELGAVSQLNQADMLLRSGDAAGALRVLENLDRTAPETMRQIVTETLAAAAEEAGDTARAVRAYQALAESGDAQNAAFYRARIAALESAPSE